MRKRGIHGCTRCLAITLSQLLVWASICPARAEQTQAAEPEQAPATGQLHIVIVKGEGATNNIRQRTGREAIVKVEDENHKPVAGAAVTFLLPGSGPSGTFANGSKLLSVITDAKGQAVMRGVHANAVTGQVHVSITASFHGLKAVATVTQTNAAAGAAAGGAVAGGIITTKVVIIAGAVAAAAATGGAIAATRGGGGGTPPPTQPSLTLTPGSPSVGGPH
jgi:hypothetical protein